MSLALLTLLAAIAATLVLYGSRRGSAAHSVGGVLHVLLAGVTTWAAVSFFSRGLGDWLGVIVSTLLAFASWAGLARQWLEGRRAAEAQRVTSSMEESEPREAPPPSAARPAVSARAVQGRTRGERQAYRARRRRRIAGLIALSVAALGVVAGVLFLLQRKPAHDDPVVRLFLAPDESELFSVDLRGTVKRWSLPGGAYRGQERSPILATARRIEAGPGDRFLAFLPQGIAILNGLEQASPAALWPDVPDAALASDGSVVLADAAGITWRPVHNPGAIAQQLPWAEGGRHVAVSRAGEVSFTDPTNAVVTARGTPPVVVRTVALSSACDRLLYTPSGSFLLLLDSRRGSFAFLGREASEPVEGPEGFDSDHVGFIGPDTLVTGVGGARRIDLAKREGQPYWRAGISTTTLVASSRYGLAVFAAGPEIHVVERVVSPAPGDKAGGDGLRSRRLRHWRF